MLLFWFALAAVYSIPSSWLVGHVEESRAILQEESLYDCNQNAAHLYGMHYDNYTTYHMLNLAIQPSAFPVSDALESRSYWNGDFDVALGCAIEGESNSSYPRYWHGYLVFLRPLLIFFNVVQIRLICQAAFFVAMAVVIARLAIARGAAGTMAAVLLMASFAAFGAAQAAETLPLFPSFFLSMIGCLGALKLSSIRAQLSDGSVFSEGFSCFCLFGILGAFTVYFDFLDNPILTLCATLSIYLFCEKDDLPLRRVLVVVAFSSLGWLCGYGLLWAGKWVLASIVTGQPIIENALTQAAFRSGVSEEGAEAGGAIEAIRKNVHFLGFMKYAYVAVGIAAFGCVAAAILRSLWLNKKLTPFSSVLMGLLLVSTMPYLWYAALSNHSIVHAGLMAYRTQIGALLPWLLIVGLSVGRRRGGEGCVRQLGMWFE